MKVACALILDFEVAVELIRRPAMAGQPVVVGGLPHERKTVRSRSPEAATYGVAEGMPLRQARGLCPEAVFLPLDEELYQETLGRVLRALEGFSPTVEVDTLGERGGLARREAAGTAAPPGGSLSVYLDAFGLERLFGPDEELGRRIAAAVEGQTGLRPRVGLGSNKFVARMAALQATPGSPLVVREGEERPFLAPLPVERIPCSQEMLRRLHLLGLRTLEQLAGLPPGALGEQFGPEGVEAYRLARGIDERLLVAREVPVLLEEEVEIDPPTPRGDLLLSAASVLLARLVARMRSDYLACREVALLLGLSDAPPIRLATTLHEATEKEKELRRAVERLLDRVEVLTPHPGPPPPGGRAKAPSSPPGGGREEGGEGGRIHLLRLTLSGFGGQQGEQLGLFRSRTGSLQMLCRALEEAAEQFGESALHPLAEVTKEKAPITPLRVIASAEGEPEILLLEGRRERVREVCNRWRVREDWWRQEVYRDYYRLITESGRLCVVFRDLSPQPPFPGRKGERLGPGWFLERIYA